MSEGSFNPLTEVITGLFHVMFYNSDHTWQQGFTKWQGVSILQNPFDMWIKQEILWETKPDLIIETGSALGGTALFYVSAYPKCYVISVDTQEMWKVEVKHPRIKFLKGSSTNPKMVKEIKDYAKKFKRVMVILDSDHTEDHVYKEIGIYSPLVTPGCYLVVEDTNIGGNPVTSNVPGRGPMAAVQRFIEGEGQEYFEIDKSKEKYYMTFYPNGWLRRRDK